MQNLRRRKFIKSAVSGLAPLGFLANTSCTQGHRSEQVMTQDAWKKMAEIKGNIVAPIFPARDFDVRNFGGSGDDSTDCTAAFEKAIAACHAAGGGRVLVTHGSYRSGPIHLKSNVNLHIAESAKIVFIPEPDRYLPAVFTRWEGVELMGYSPLIYAINERNVAVTGRGTLDGSGSNELWWPWKGKKSNAHWRIIPGQDQKHARNKLFADAENGIPPEQRYYAENSFLRPSFIQPYKCENVLIEGVTIINSPFWLLHPVLCENVTIRHVTCRSHGPNNDGCDPESCRNVLIENCLFDTGDDCIAIKSGRNADGRRVNVASENIVVSNCVMKDGHGGLVMGSEISGGVNHVFLENCEMSSPELERAVRIKTNARRGGTIEKIFVRNLLVGKVKDAVVINFYYEEGDEGDFDPQVRDITIEDMICEEARRAFYLRGFARAPIEKLTFRNCQFKSVEKSNIVEHVHNVAMDAVYVNGRALNDFQEGPG